MDKNKKQPAAPLENKLPEMIWVSASLLNAAIKLKEKDSTTCISFSEDNKINNDTAYILKSKYDKVLQLLSALDKYTFEHDSGCYRSQNWDEARQALADTPEHLRDGDWHFDSQDVENKSKLCTCGLDDLFDKISKVLPEYS